MSDSDLEFLVRHERRRSGEVWVDGEEDCHNLIEWQWFAERTAAGISVAVKQSHQEESPQAKSHE
ncbi:hypothetical protein ACHAWO_002947 [Cyclotella atomus]|uniref:Uncharacterized protein n=1 Tax=Cyclotella atomus TaxID=382360 RepID=A0ABD3MUD3_9STRA